MARAERSAWGQAVRCGCVVWMCCVCGWRGGRPSSGRFGILGGSQHPHHTTTTNTGHRPRRGAGGAPGPHLLPPQLQPRGPQRRGCGRRRGGCRGGHGRGRRRGDAPAERAGGPTEAWPAAPAGGWGADAVDHRAGPGAGAGAGGKGGGGGDQGGCLCTWVGVEDATLGGASGVLCCICVRGRRHTPTRTNP